MVATRSSLGRRTWSGARILATTQRSRKQNHLDSETCELARSIRERRDNGNSMTSTPGLMAREPERIWKTVLGRVKSSDGEVDEKEEASSQASDGRR